MRILITGGFGFIGGRIGQHLSRNGHEILLGSRNINASPEWLPGSQVVQTDWNNTAVLADICNNIDVVIHTASMNDRDSLADPISALAFNGVVTSNLVQAACTQKVKLFIYFSTAHIYASPLTGSITEDSCPRNLHPYATSHRAGENGLLWAIKNEKINGCVVRLSNAFGIPAHKNANCWQTLVHDLCKQAVLTQKMVLHSSGEQQRDFIGMMDVCRAIAHFINPGTSLAPVINLGSGNARTVFEMAQFIRERCKVTLGFTPSLERQEPGSMEKHQPLYYNSIVLKEMNFLMDKDFEAEVDQLLLFCNQSFISVD